MSRVRVPDGAPGKGARTEKRLPREKRLVGQAVKTPASHAGNGGSIPPRVIFLTGTKLEMEESVVVFSLLL